MSENNLKESVFSCKRDDLVIRGTEYRLEGDRLPIVIVSHGFMSKQDRVRPYTKLLAELGYAAYCFDFCGGCLQNQQSDGDTSKMSVLTEVEDLKAVIKYTKSLPYTDENNIILMGCSQGGFVSAIVGSELSNEISKLVLFYPAFCIPDDARKGNMQIAQFDPNNVPDIFYCGPMKLGKIYAEDVMQMDPYKETENFTGDILLIHGTGDTIVDVKYSDKYYEVMKEKHPTSTIIYERLEGAPHGFNDTEFDPIAIKYLKDFVKR